MIFLLAISSHYVCHRYVSSIILVLFKEKSSKCKVKRFATLWFTT